MWITAHIVMEIDGKEIARKKKSGKVALEHMVAHSMVHDALEQVSAITVVSLDTYDGAISSKEKI